MEVQSLGTLLIADGSVGNRRRLKVPLDRESHQAGDPFHLEFSHDVSAISVDGFGADF